MGSTAQALDDKPAIAVLPFAHLDVDPAYPHLGEAIAEEVITTLSRVPQLRVIARASSFQYRASAPDLQTIGDQLGVRYVLQGSIRSAGGRVRVTAHLGDVATGDEIWSDRYDRDLDDVFAVEDEISAEIAVTLDVKLGFGEQVRAWRRGVTSLAAYEHFANYMEEYLRFNRHANVRARGEAMAAVELEPAFAMAYVALASTYATEAHFRWSADRDESLRLARKAVESALEAEPGYAEANALLGRVHMLAGDYDAAIVTTGKALEDLPSSAISHHLQAMNLFYAGRFAEAAAADRQLFLLSPLADTQMDNARVYLAAAYCHMGRFADALVELDEVLSRRPRWQTAHAHRVVALAGVGHPEAAREEAIRILQINPRFSTSWFATINPYRNAEDLDRILDALLGAGLPELPGESDLDIDESSSEALFPSGRALASVLFTDIVSSTQLAVELGDRRWRKTLDAHDEASRVAVKANHGRVIKSTGDGVLAVFERPGDAIRCAQVLLAGSGKLGFSLRAGIHTGELEVRQDDVGGIAVHIAARVSAKADANQILLTRTVKDLVAGSGFDLNSAGLTELRGLPDQQELFSVRG